MTDFVLQMVAVFREENKSDTAQLGSIFFILYYANSDEGYEHK